MQTAPPLASSASGCTRKDLAKEPGPGQDASDSFGSDGQASLHIRAPSQAQDHGVGKISDEDFQANAAATFHESDGKSQASRTEKVATWLKWLLVLAMILIASAMSWRNSLPRESSS